MTDSLRGRCELFVGNRLILRQTFKLETTHILSLCSYLYANEKAIAESESILEKKREIRKKSGFFSSFASFSLIALSTLNALEPNSTETLDRAFEIYGKLRKSVPSSSYLSLAAYLLAKHRKSDTDTAISLTVSLFNTLKKLFPRHRFGDDIVYSALLAISGKTAEDLVRTLGECTLYLSQSLSKQSVKQLSIACAINGGEAAFCCKRFIALRDEIEKRGIKIDKNDRYTLLHVFTLSCIRVPENELADSVFEIYDYLKKEKGFGAAFGRTQRLVYSILLLYGEYIPESDEKSDEEVRESVKGSTLSVLTSISAVICAEISWALAAISVI